MKAGLFYSCILALVLFTVNCTPSVNESVKTQPAQAQDFNKSAAPPKVNTPVMPSQFTQDTFFAHIDNNVDTVLRTSALLNQQDPKIQKWQNSIQGLKQYIRAQLPGLKGKTVHVILQNHGAMNNTSTTPESETLYSQNNIAKLLPTLKPTVIALEGAYSDSLTNKADVTKEIVNGIEEMYGKPPESPTQEQIDDAYEAIMLRSSALQFVFRHPECHAIGAEFSSLSLMTFVFMEDGAPPQAKNNIQELQELRSWSMLARTSEFMTKYKTTEGVLVIGSFHRYDFEQIARLFDAKVVFHDTTK